jgi:hypothetical protein
MVSITAHDLAADPLYENVCGFRLPGGRVVWGNAQYLERGQYQRVLVWRLVAGPRVIKRWVDPDTALQVVTVCEVMSPELDARQGYPLQPQEANGW